MELLWISLGVVFILAGFVGCLLPIIPGPPLSYVGILFLQLLNPPKFSSSFMLIWAGITLLAVVLDYVVPIYGTKKMGGTRRGVVGSIIGLLLGLFLFPPIGIIIGPAIGAFIGEVTGGKEGKKAIKAATGSLLGFFTGTILKLIVSGFLAMYFFSSLL